MRLTKVERERMTDSMLKIQSVRANLQEIDPAKVPNVNAVQECLETCNRSLKEALGYEGTRT